MPTEIPHAIYERDISKRILPNEVRDTFEEEETAWYTLRILYEGERESAGVAVEGLIKIIKMHDTGNRLKLWGQWPENDGQPPTEENVAFMDEKGFLQSRVTPNSEGYLIDPSNLEDGDGSEVEFELQKPSHVSRIALAGSLA